jgi:hypothetical protein
VDKNVYEAAQLLGAAAPGKLPQRLAPGEPVCRFDGSGAPRRHRRRRSLGPRRVHAPHTRRRVWGACARQNPTHRMRVSKPLYSPPTAQQSEGIADAPALRVERSSIQTRLRQAVRVGRGAHVHVPLREKESPSELSGAQFNSAAPSSSRSTRRIQHVCRLRRVPRGYKCRESTLCEQIEGPRGGSSSESSRSELESSRSELESSRGAARFGARFDSRGAHTYDTTCAPRMCRCGPEASESNRAESSSARFRAARFRARFRGAGQAALGPVGPRAAGPLGA